jgi:hypothetical protein
MKNRFAILTLLVSLFVSGSAFAMMDQNGGGMGTGGMGSGGMGNGGGMGSGMGSAGGMKSGMFAMTMHNASLDVLTPIATPQEAITAIQGFIDSAKSGLQISAVWEYQTVFKAELSDATGQRAFDVIAEKLTGAVLPEMGVAMMMNASYGKQLQKTPKFKKHLVLAPDEAVSIAQAFVSKNASIINYNLASPETYPGYYKFHTTDTSGKAGIDILINGYNGNIWMNTQLGAPISPVPVIP